jgi:hypothetical protein
MSREWQSSLYREAVILLNRQLDPHKIQIQQFESVGVHLNLNFHVPWRWRGQACFNINQTDFKKHFQSSQFLNPTRAACSAKWHIKAIRLLLSSAKFILNDASTVLTVHLVLPQHCNPEQHQSVKKELKLSTCETSVPAAVSGLQTSGMRRRVVFLDG